MIEVDLRPERERRRQEGWLSRLKPDLSGGPSAGDLLGSPWNAAAVIAAVVVLGGMAYSWLSLQSRSGDLDARLEEAVTDSTRIAELQTLNDSLTSRRENVRRRVQLVRELDRDRFVWPHLLDELSGALPDVVWLVSVSRTSALPNLTVDVRGVAANPLAITRYVRNLRDSPYVGSAQIQGSNRQQVSGMTAQGFTVRVTYRRPPDAQVRTRPLVRTGGG